MDKLYDTELHSDNIACLACTVPVISNAAVFPGLSVKLTPDASALVAPLA